MVGLVGDIRGFEGFGQVVYTLVVYVVWWLRVANVEVFAHNPKLGSCNWTAVLGMVMFLEKQARICRIYGIYRDVAM